MLAVTGQRPKHRAPRVVDEPRELFTGDELADQHHAINRREISGKRKGATVMVEAADGTYVPYIASGERPEDPWMAYTLPAGGAGGGGGVSVNAIVALDGSSEDSMIRVTRASGVQEEVELMPTIQNTPSFAMVINNQGYNKSPHCNMVKGDGDNNGVKVSELNAPVSLPVWMYDYGGTVKGGMYDTDTGDFYVGANNVEISVQTSYMLGVHPDWPKYSQGKPQGAYATRVHLEQKQPDGSWVELGYKDQAHSSQSSAYPNTMHLNNNSASTSFVVAAPTAGWYRLRYSVTAYGNDSSVIPWIRFGAVADGWMSSNSSNHYFQVKGVIKDVSSGTPIVPVPRP